MVLYLSSSSFEPSWAGELLIWARGYRISEEGKVIVGQDKQSKPPGGSGHGAGLSRWAGRKGKDTREHGADIAPADALFLHLIASPETRCKCL